MLSTTIKYTLSCKILNLTTYSFYAIKANKDDVKMDIVSLITISSIAYLILRFGMSPILARQRKSLNSLKAISRMAAEAIVTTAASIAFLLTISGLLTLGLTNNLQNLKSSPLPEARRSLEFAQEISQLLGTIEG